MKRKVIIKYLLNKILYAAIIFVISINIANLIQMGIEINFKNDTTTINVQEEATDEVMEKQVQTKIEQNIPESNKFDNSQGNDQKNEKVYNGTVCLTFDDGPSELTPQYLDVLYEKGVKATFFITGFDNDKLWKADIINKELENGHTVGLHGQSHDYSEIYSSVENAQNNFLEQKSKLEEFVGEGIEYKYIRFPGGSSNTVSKKYCDGVMTAITKSMEEQGYIYYDWNVDSNDAGSDVNSSEAIYQNVIEAIKPGRTNVVLMHDSANHSATLEALPKIIEYLQQENYNIVPITEDTKVIHHKIFN